MIINHYVRHIPEAQFTEKCAVCDDTAAAGFPVYWLGRNTNAKELGRVCHEGCYWDDKKRGPAPHLTWEQVEALHLATAGGYPKPKDKETEVNVQRLLGAVEKDVTLKRLKLVPPRGPKDAALRMGPDLLDGYRYLTKALGHAQDPWWRPVEANGTTHWVNPEKAPNVERPTMTPAELKARAEALVRDSIRQQALKAAFREKYRA